MNRMDKGEHTFLFFIDKTSDKEKKGMRKRAVTVRWYYQLYLRKYI